MEQGNVLECSESDVDQPLTTLNGSISCSQHRKALVLFLPMIANTTFGTDVVKRDELLDPNAYGEAKTVLMNLVH
ncbi:hypothetical protein NECAME_18271 [Necator americanus]|uniref:Uncharacterized protein n=1 Tax=Necator americanus TaxID=51031 RepID=W2SVH8_NECAM|nr:hypothetical protein NECAME_18271 [Necator americanus]ETN73533.1 hypothetical protein NECAME_18271 [Necator americanus]